MGDATPRPSTGSVVIVALVAFAAVGVAALASRSASLPDFVASLMSSRGQSILAMYWLLVIVPAGLPMTLVGAFLARRLLERTPPGQPFSAWALRGAAFGALLGAAGCVLWFSFLNARQTEALPHILPAMAGAGGIAGMVVGLVVGAWCWRLASRPA